MPRRECGTRYGERQRRPWTDYRGGGGRRTALSVGDSSLWPPQRSVRHRLVFNAADSRPCGGSVGGALRGRTKADHGRVYHLIATRTSRSKRPCSGPLRSAREVHVHEMRAVRGRLSRSTLQGARMPAKIEHLRRLAAAGDSDARSALERWDRRTGRDDGLAECAERLLGSVDDLLAELVEMSLEWQPFWARIKEVECLLDAERARIRSASRRRQGDDDGSVEPSPALDGQAHEPQPDEVPGDDRGLHSRSRYPIRSVCPLTRAGAALKRADEVHTLMVYIGRKLPVCEAEERNATGGRGAPRAGAEPRRREQLQRHPGAERLFRSVPVDVRSCDGRLASREPGAVAAGARHTLA